MFRCEENGHSSQLSRLIVDQSQTDLPRLTIRIDTYTLRIEAHEHANINEIYKRKPNALFGCPKNFRVVEITSRYYTRDSTASRLPNTIQMKCTQMFQHNLYDYNIIDVVVAKTFLHYKYMFYT